MNKEQQITEDQQATIKDKNHPNQCRHLINHTRFILNAGLIMKKQP